MTNLLVTKRVPKGRTATLDLVTKEAVFPAKIKAATSGCRINIFMVACRLLVLKTDGMKALKTPIRKRYIDYKSKIPIQNFSTLLPSHTKECE